MTKETQGQVLHWRGSSAIGTDSSQSSKHTEENVSSCKMWVWIWTSNSIYHFTPIFIAETYSTLTHAFSGSTSTPYNHLISDCECDLIFINFWAAQLHWLQGNWTWFTSGGVTLELNQRFWHYPCQCTLNFSKSSFYPYLLSLWQHVQWLAVTAWAGVGIAIKP